MLGVRGASTDGMEGRRCRASCQTRTYFCRISVSYYRSFNVSIGFGTIPPASGRWYRLFVPPH